MRLSFKYKYKKFFWLLIGFCLACICISKVKAWSDISNFVLPDGVTPKTNKIIIYYSTSRYNTGYFGIFLNKDGNYFYSYYSGDTFPTISNSGGIRVTNSPNSSTPLTGWCRWSWVTNGINNEPSCVSVSDQILPRPGTVIWTNTSIYSPNGTYFEPYVINFNLNGATMWTNGNNSVPYSLLDFENAFENSSSAIDFINNHNLTNGDLIFDGWYYDADFTQPFSTEDTLSHNITLYAKFSESLPDYLSGYKKITLTTEDKYYMLSGISEGYVFIPTDAFLDYGGRLSYYDNNLDSQPYTSYIQDYITMPDGEYVRQSFNLSNYTGADWVMFSKYIYLEGEDDITYDIYVPNDIYDSNVTVTPNTSGGNNFDFEYKDENGDIQNGQVISTDLSQISPLLGNVFSDFSSNTFGLTSIITAPLGLISSLSSSSCSSLSLPLPYVNTNLTLPCMTTVYQNTFGSFFTLYQTITFGIVAYWVIVKIFNIIKDAKNPDHDEIEVIDL